jgi:hypothetical protein
MCEALAELGANIVIGSRDLEKDEVIASMYGHVAPDHRIYEVQSTEIRRVMAQRKQASFSLLNILAVSWRPTVSG